MIFWTTSNLSAYFSTGESFIYYGREIFRKTNISYALIRTLRKWLRCWIPNTRVSCSKPLGVSKIDSVFDPSAVDQVSARNFLELSGKK